MVFNFEPILNRKFPFTTFGVPKVQVSENGVARVKRVFQEVGFRAPQVNPLGPRSNGSAENTMKKLTKALKLAKWTGISDDEALRRFFQSGPRDAAFDYRRGTSRRPQPKSTTCAKRRAATMRQQNKRVVSILGVLHVA